MGGIFLIETIVNINYLVDGISSTLQAKMFYEKTEENELINVHFEMSVGAQSSISKKCDTLEDAIVYLQSVLPQNISLVCCMSCRHGNFCTYGNNDDEIFCLKGFTPKNKSDVCDLFSNHFNLIKEKSRRFLDFCKEYAPIDDATYYTYNDWKIRQSVLENRNKAAL